MYLGPDVVTSVLRLPSETQLRDMPAHVATGFMSSCLGQRARGL